MDGSDKTRAYSEVHIVQQSADSSVIIRADNAKLAELGYRSEFRREFSVRQIKLHLGSSIADRLIFSSKAI